MADLAARLANHWKALLQRRKRSQCRGDVVTECKEVQSPDRIVADRRA